MPDCVDVDANTNTQHSGTRVHNQNAGRRANAHRITAKLTGNFAKVAPLALQATIRLTSLTYLARAATPAKRKGSMEQTIRGCMWWAGG